MYALLIAVAACIGITIYRSCSADEDFWGFDEEYTSTENTRSEVKDMSEYLTLSTYEPNKWTYEDNMIIQKALNRMTIKSKDGMGFIQETKGSELNMSKELFNFIKNGFEGGNKLMKENNHSKSYNKKSISRRKTRNPENFNFHNCTYQDCVGHCIAYYRGLNVDEVNNTIQARYSYYPDFYVRDEDIEDVFGLFWSFVCHGYFLPQNATFPYAVPGIILIPNHAINGYYIYIYGSDYVITCYDDQKKKMWFFFLYTNQCAPCPENVSTTLFGYYT